jgi:hypothetical protein
MPGRRSGSQGTNFEGFLADSRMVLTMLDMYGKAIGVNRRAVEVRSVAETILLKKEINLYRYSLTQAWQDVLCLWSGNLRVTVFPYEVPLHSKRAEKNRIEIRSGLFSKWARTVGVVAVLEGDDPAEARSTRLSSRLCGRVEKWIKYNLNVISCFISQKKVIVTRKR